MKLTAFYPWAMMRKPLKEVEKSGHWGSEGWSNPMHILFVTDMPHARQSEECAFSYLISNPVPLGGEEAI
jgi:hypothetical protein